MKTSDFDYSLPEHLIAYAPLAERSQSRLLCLNPVSGTIHDRVFSDLTDLLSPGDLLVFNNSKVIPARLSGHRDTGGKVSILIERVLNDHRALAHVKSGNTPPEGGEIILSDGSRCQVCGRQDGLFILDCIPSPEDRQMSWHAVMERVGDIPLPPYIDRQTQPEDTSRYQTVYAADDKAASVAAPTAGLHFDHALLKALQDKGIGTAYVTLHVGAGTFQPLRTEDEEDPRNHPIHTEYVEIPEEVCRKVHETQQAGRRVIAVGTTAVRCLETAYNPLLKSIEPFYGETDIFIAPGYEFGCVDGMITNFHFPRTTLLMLVSALTGRDFMMNAYVHAIEKSYRFFSYGDAMYIGK